MLVYQSVSENNYAKYAEVWADLKCMKISGIS